MAGDGLAQPASPPSDSARIDFWFWPCLVAFPSSQFHIYRDMSMFIHSRCVQVGIAKRIVDLHPRSSNYFPRWEGPRPISRSLSWDLKVQRGHLPRGIGQSSRLIYVLVYVFSLSEIPHPIAGEWYCAGHYLQRSDGHPSRIRTDRGSAAPGSPKSSPSQGLSRRCTTTQLIWDTEIHEADLFPPLCVQQILRWAYPHTTNGGSFLTSLP